MTEEGNGDPALHKPLVKPLQRMVALDVSQMSSCLVSNITADNMGLRLKVLDIARKVQENLAGDL